MTKHSMDMSKEKEPTGSVLFDEGWHEWEIVNIEGKTSKSGNEMFVIKLAEGKTMGVINVYAVAVEEKRWLLKQFLGACGIAPSEEGYYDWDSDNLIGRMVQGFVENEPNDYIDREGVERKSTRSQIRKFKPLV